MSLDTQDSRIGFRCPSYLKQYVEDKAKRTGCSSGEIIRRMMFMDMVLNYSPEGVRKLKGLRDTYEAAGGVMPSSLIESMLGRPCEPQDAPIEEALRIGFRSVSVDPTERFSTADMVRELVKPVDVSENVDKQPVRQVVEQTGRNENEKVEQNVERNIESPVEPYVEQKVEHHVEALNPVPEKPKKPKRPKMGATNFMI